MKEKTLKSQILYEGKILNVYKDKVELENGKEDIREYVHNDGGVCVLALTENQEIIFVKQFRYPFKEVFVCVCVFFKEILSPLFHCWKRK